MNFGKAIAFSFVVFAVFIGVLVGVCVKQEMSLVSADYYQREIEHGSKMAVAEQTLQLSSRPVVWFHRDQLAVAWENMKQVDHARLHLYRPSDQDLDRDFDIATPSSDTVALQATGLQPGLYRASFTWSMDGRDYLVEQVVIR